MPTVLLVTEKNHHSMGVIEETMKLSLEQPNFSFLCLPGFELLSHSPYIILNSPNQINAFPYFHWHYLCRCSGIDHFINGLLYKAGPKSGSKIFLEKNISKTEKKFRGRGKGQISIWIDFWWKSDGRSRCCYCCLLLPLLLLLLLLPNQSRPNL